MAEMVLLYADKVAWSEITTILLTWVLIIQKPELIGL